MTRVDANDREAIFPLRALWAWRDLWLLLVRRHVLVRYKQTALGLAWAVLPPVLHVIVFTLVFSEIAGVGGDGLPYPVFAYVGMLPWGYFAAVVASTGGCLAANGDLISQAYFPRQTLLLAAAAARAVDLAIGVVLLFGLLVIYGVPLRASLAWVPLIALLPTVLALGLGMLFASVNVRWRDVSHALPLLLQVGLFATPVAYPLAMVGPRWRPWIERNPMTPIVEATRAAVEGSPLPWSGLGLSLAFALGLFVVGAWLFARAERTFADWA